MKNDYNQAILLKSWEKFQKLKQSSHYREAWINYKICFDQFRDGKSLEQKDPRVIYGTVRWYREIQDRWGVNQPIDPDLKLKETDLFKSIRPGSPLAHFIYALVSPDGKLLAIRDQQTRISSLTRDEQKDFRKFTCYMYWKNLEFSWSRIGRELGITKDTAQKWALEVDRWPEEKKLSVSQSIRKTQPQPRPNIPLDKFEHALSNEGLINTGRRLPHGSSDQQSENEGRKHLL